MAQLGSHAQLFCHTRACVRIHLPPLTLHKTHLCICPQSWKPKPIHTFLCETLASTGSNSPTTPDMPMPRGKHSVGGPGSYQPLHNEKIEARDGQLATGLKQLVGKPLDFWLYLVQIGRAMRSQRARPGFHPANMPRCSTVSLPFLNYFKKEPGPEAGGVGRAGVRFWEPASPFVDPQVPSRSLSLTPEGD